MAELASVMELLNLGSSNATALAARVAAAPNSLVPLFAKLRTEAALTGKGEEETKAISALNSLKDLANNSMMVTETYLLGSLSVALTAAGHKNSKNVRAAADEAVKAICGKMSVNSVREALEVLFASSAVGQAWQSRVLALNMIALFGDYAPEQLGNNLPVVVPQLTVSMSDVKKEVKEAATAAMIASCDVIGNRDIEHMTPHIVRYFTPRRSTRDHAQACWCYLRPICQCICFGYGGTIVDPWFDKQSYCYSSSICCYH